jgi:hypothetical protein
MVRCFWEKFGGGEVILSSTKANDQAPVRRSSMDRKMQHDSESAGTCDKTLIEAGLESVPKRRVFCSLSKVIKFFNLESTLSESSRLNMAQNREQHQTEDEPRDVDQDVWRSIHYLDPDGARDWHYLAFILACLALVTLVLALAAWIKW